MIHIKWLKQTKRLLITVGSLFGLARSEYDAG
jgi:hypothetical protein